MPNGRPVRAWKDRRHPVWLYRGVQVLVGWFLRFLFLCRRRNVKRLPKRGPVILATNHVSNLDPVLVVASMRRPVFHLAKHTLFRSRLGRWFFETLGGQIPVDRETGGNEAALEAGQAALDRGLALGIYPEGARSVDGRLKRGRTGVARLAFLTGVAIYPVAVGGTFGTWPKGRSLPRFFRRTEVLVGEPIEVAKDAAAADDPDRARELTDRVMRALADLLGQPDYDPAAAGWADAEEAPGKD